MSLPRTVLVIDDDANVRESLQMALEDRGFRVLCAGDGEAGISRALKEFPDLIICDMMMPRASGFVVIERLKHHHGLSIPIIMLTANESDYQRAYAESLGVDDYLSKPIPAAQLFSSVDRCLPELELAST